MSKCKWVGLVLLATLAAGQAAELRQSALPEWKLALHGYTFNKKTLLETLELARDLGIPYFSATRGQKIGKDFPEIFEPKMSAAATAAIKAKLAETGVKIVAYGVTGIPAKEPEARAFFAWAKGWGIEVCYTEIKAEQFPLADKLSAEYGVKLGLHNHPKPSPYWDPQIVLDKTKGFAQLGATADTGHWCRSGLNPLACLKQLDGHIAALHFKDVKLVDPRKNKWEDQPWGTGTCDARAMLAELKRQGFKGVFGIEYEKMDAQLVENVRASADWWFRTVKELAAP